MLRFSLLGIPVGVEWIFWISTVLLGGGWTAQTQEDWVEVGVWVAVVFVSILVHEFGHALAGKKFGARPVVRLHSLGGMTFLPGATFTRAENLFVCAAGPLAGLALGAAVFALARFVPEDYGWIRVAIHFALYVNFFWTFLNLLPIQPLDGGQILRLTLGSNRLRLAGWIGAVLAVALCVWAWSHQQFFLALFFGFLAYHNFQMRPTPGGVVTETIEQPNDVNR